MVGNARKHSARMRGQLVIRGHQALNWVPRESFWVMLTQLWWSRLVVQMTRCLVQIPCILCPSNKTIRSGETRYYLLMKKPRKVDDFLKTWVIWVSYDATLGDPFVDWVLPMAAPQRASLKPYAFSLLWSQRTKSKHLSKIPNRRRLLVKSRQLARRQN